MTFKAKSAKSSHPITGTWGQNVKYVNHYKYLVVILDTELSDGRHSETTAIPILYSKQAASLFFPMFKCC